MSARASAEKCAKGWGDQVPVFDASTEAWLAGLSKPEALRHLRRVIATLTEIEKQLQAQEAASSEPGSLMFENVP